MRRFLLLIWWLIMDALLFASAYALAYLLRIGTFHSTNLPFDRYMQTVALVVPVWLGIMGFLRIFTLTRVQNSRRNIEHILFSCAMGLSLFTIAYFFLWQGITSRLLLSLAGTISFLLIMGWHLVFSVWQRKILRSNPPAYPLLIVGINRETERMIRLLNDRESPFMPVAVLDSRGTSATDIAGVPVMGKLNKLEDVIREKHITHLMQCADIEHTLNLLSVCRQHGITYILLPSVLGIVGANERVDTLEGQLVTMVPPR